MSVPKEFPLLQVAEETSHVEQHMDSPTVDEIRRFLDLDSDDSDSYPEPCGHTTRSVAAVHSDIDRASTQRLALMRAFTSSNEGPESRAARSARFAAQRMAEREALEAALRPQVATRHQLPEHTSPFTNREEYPFFNRRLHPSPPNWPIPQNFARNISIRTQTPPNPPAHRTSIDPRFCSLPTQSATPNNQDQTPFHLYNTLPPTQEPAPPPHPHPTIPPRISPPSSHSSRSPTPATPPLNNHRLQHNDPTTPHRGPGRPPGSKNKPKTLTPRPSRPRGRPPGSKNKVNTAIRHEERETAIRGLGLEFVDEGAWGSCGVVMDGDDIIWVG